MADKLDDKGGKAELEVMEDEKNGETRDKKEEAERRKRGRPKKEGKVRRYEGSNWNEELFGEGEVERRRWNDNKGTRAVQDAG